MTVSPDRDLAQFETVRTMAWAMLAAAPPVYLIVMYFLKVPARVGGETELMLYILLAVGIVLPALAYPIERAQISSFTKHRRPMTSPGRIYMTTSITRFALVKAVYIYAVVVYLLTGSMTNALYFYPIGIGWTIVHWPRRDAFEQFLKRVQQNEPRD